MISEDPAALRAAFGHFPSGVAALCADLGADPRGIVATSFSVGVSFDPPLVLFSVQNSSTTWPMLRSAERIGVSVLSRHHSDVARRLASRSPDKFDGLDTVTTTTGSIFLAGASLWMDCEIASEIPAGDHQIVVLEVKSLKVESSMEPLVYHAAQFRELAQLN